MGSNTSKSAEAPKTQVWTSESPVRFSQPLVDGLQTTTESDSTRSKTLELHIQSRVNAELQRLHEQATKDFETLSAKISAQSAATGSSSSPSSSSGTPSSSGKSAGDTLRDIGRESVQNEVRELKKKLEQRKSVKEVDEGVERAKAEVVKCLRGHDRRPLDCWREVEEFKREVGRLEGAWVEKVIR